jgi:hypothetical protein
VFTFQLLARPNYIIRPNNDYLRIKILKNASSYSNILKQFIEDSLSIDKTS